MKIKDTMDSYNAIKCVSQNVADLQCASRLACLSKDLNSLAPCEMKASTLNKWFLDTYKRYWDPPRIRLTYGVKFETAKGNLLLYCDDTTGNTRLVVTQKEFRLTPQTDMLQVMGKLDGRTFDMYGRKATWNSNKRLFTILTHHMSCFEEMEIVQKENITDIQALNVIYEMMTKGFDFREFLMSDLVY
jgi:hypothetical protein